MSVMTVEILISLLKDFPLDAQVVVEDWRGVMKEIEDVDGYNSADGPNGAIDTVAIQFGESDA